MKEIYKKRRIKIQEQIRKYMNTQQENSNKKRAWYELLILDHFVEYVKSDPDYEKDFKNKNSVINHFWDVIEGFTFGNIIREHPSKAKDAAKDIEGLGYGWWVLKGYWVYINDEDNERDIGVIAKSIREKDESRSFYEHDLKELSEVQLAFLIMYSSWSRLGCNDRKYEFTTSGHLKKYILALKQKCEAKGIECSEDGIKQAEKWLSETSSKTGF